ncbi:MAG TPA: enoyl-CoA hydratase-related protein [Alphaproteobacteria bacterium]|nr:enoyl-CoA hydratase-related protein [Alphaproteobacteria bacterium]
MIPVEYTLHGDVAVLAVNYPPVNALSYAVRDGMMNGVKRGLADDAVKGLVIIGGGTTFIVGADITEFGTPKAIASPRIRDIQEILDASVKPVVAAIHGAALGGGLELAMACHVRIAVNSAKVGLPEVKLGLLPGASGTVRLPRLVGPEIALELITSGDHVSAARALEVGIVDAIVNDLLDGAIFDAFRAEVAKKARGQLAPFKIIDCIEAACSKSFADAIAFENEAFLSLLNGDQRKALVHYFFAEREARKIPGIGVDVKPLAIDKVASSAPG